MKNTGRHNRITALLMIIALTAAVLSGCTTFNSFKHTFIDEKTHKDEEVIYIGVFEPRSGDLAQQGNDEIKGIELANKIYGNVNGTRIELIIIDNQSSTGSAKTAIQDLIAMKPVLIIGSSGEALSMIASPYIEEAKIPTITPSATNPLITQNNPYYFRACITDTQRGAGLAEYAFRALGSHKIGLITISNDSSSKMLADGFVDKLNKLSPRNVDPIVLRTTVNMDDTEMDGLVDKIRASEANVIFMPVGLEKADIIFTKVEEAGLSNIVFLGDPSWASPDFAAMMDKHPGIYIAFPSDSVASETGTTQNSVTDETERFQIEYTNKYGTNDVPTENTALGYDSYLLAVNAINRAENHDPESVRDALAGIKGLQCTTGVFEFDEYGNPVREVNIVTYNDKKELVLLYSTRRTEAEEMKQLETEETLNNED